MQIIDSPKKPKALADWTYEYLKGKILNLEIMPGEQIHIEVLSKELEVSRTPIREAFLRLVADGLIEIRPRVGYFVADITENDIQDLFEIREIVETRAANKAAYALSDDELQGLKKLIVESKAAVDKGDYEAYLGRDILFHNYLQKHIQNKRLVAFMESLNDLTHRERIMSIRSVENIKETILEHEQIVDSLLARDGDKAAWYMGEHLKRVSDRLVKILKDSKQIKEK
jgi:GntR family transcriptional regulator, rspAB operon transcriptional repressor